MWVRVQISLTPVAVIIGFLGLFLWSVGTPFYSSDGIVMYHTARAIALDHRLEQDVEDLPQLIPIGDGQAYSKYDIGMPLLAAPVVAYADDVAQRAIANRYAVAAIFVMLVPALGMALTLGVVYGVAYRLGGRPRPALIVVLVAGLGTILWPYARLFFAEALTTAFLTLAFAVIILLGRRPVLQSLLVGLFLALAIITRAHTLIFVPAFLWLLWKHIPRSTLAYMMPALLGSLAGLGVVLWLNWLRFGAIWRTGYGDEAFALLPFGGIVGLLVSPGKSVFLYSPPLILSTILFPRFRRHFPLIAHFMLMVTASALLFYGAWWAWHGGWVWGPRFLVPLVPLWCLPWLVLPKKKFWIALALVIFLLGVGVQLVGTFIDVNPAYQAAFVSGTDPDDESLYAVVHYDIGRSPLLVATKHAWRGQWEIQAIYQLQSTDLTEDWVYGVPQKIEHMIFFSVLWLVWVWYRNPTRQRGKNGETRTEI